MQWAKEDKHDHRGGGGQTQDSCIESQVQISVADAY